MLKLRRILHPTDFSPSSEAAFALACSLARDHGAILLVVHIADLIGTGYEGPFAMPPHNPNDFEEVKNRLWKMIPPDAKVAVEHVFVIGDPCAEILRLAQERDCDLIAMGTHGRSGFGRLLMGSVAETVMRRATCPVLTVRSMMPQVVEEMKTCAAAAT